MSFDDPPPVTSNTKLSITLIEKVWISDIFQILFRVILSTFPLLGTVETKWNPCDQAVRIKDSEWL